MGYAMQAREKAVRAKTAQDGVEPADLQAALEAGEKALSRFRNLRLRLQIEYSRLTQIREGFPDETSRPAAPLSLRIDLRV
jgi:hypothetical protein